MVDDDQFIRLLLRLNLEAVGLHVHEAADGLSGVQAAMSGRPDMAILDLMMPGLTGFEVAERLASDPATEDVTVVFLTAKATSARERTQARELGAVALLSKPFDPISIGPFIRCLVDLPQEERFAAAEGKCRELHLTRA